MRYFWAGLAWLLGFMAVGAAAMLGFALLATHRLAALPSAAGLGAEIGTNLFVLAFCFSALPGARRRPGTPQPFGVLQGIWAMAGFAIVMAGTGLLVVNALTIDNLLHIFRHNPARIDFQSHSVLVGCTIAGEAAAGLWVLWYFLRMGPARLADGSATGLAWRAAPLNAYATAIASAFVLVVIVLLMFHFLPPNQKKIANEPLEQIFSGTGILLLPVAIIGIFVGPLLEEIVFRGIAFAGLATRLGPAWAGILTTLLFMAAHTPDEIYYPPGFLAVGLVAAVSVVLRLRYRSIRPGILLHILYNAGPVLAASLMK